VNTKKFCRDYVKDMYSIGQLCAQISSVNFDQDITSCFEDIQVSLSVVFLVEMFHCCYLLIMVTLMLPACEKVHTIGGGINETVMVARGHGLDSDSARRKSVGYGSTAFRISITTAADF